MKMELNLPKRQQDVLYYIIDFFIANTVYPTYNEIADKLGITVATLQDHLNALKKKDIIRRDEGLYRTYKISNSVLNFDEAIKILSRQKRTKEINQVIRLLKNATYA